MKSIHGEDYMKYIAHFNVFFSKTYSETIKHILTKLCKHVSYTIVCRTYTKIFDPLTNMPAITKKR